MISFPISGSSRAPLVDLVVGLAVSDRRQVVNERVVPHVKDVTFVQERAPPGDRGAGNGNVAQASLHEGVGLVAFGLGRDKPGVRVVVLNQSIFEALRRKNQFSSSISVSTEW